MTPERKNRILEVLHHRQHDLTLVLENVHDPHNISAVMRTADAVGVKEIYVLNTRISRHEKFGRKSSSSASKWLQVHQFEDAEACFKQVREKYQRVMATHLSSDAVGLYDMDLTGSIALVFGNEHEGVSQDAMKYVDGNFIIPQVGMIQSLNISVACAVTLYEAYRQKSVAGHYAQSRMTAPEQAALLEFWEIEADSLK